MWAFLTALAAAIANSIASVQQRRAGEDEPSDSEMSLRLIGDLIRNPTWLLGICAVIAGFLLQATALSMGDLAAVQPVLALELPITILLSSRLRHRRISAREWVAVVAMTAGLAGLIGFLHPQGGNATDVSGPRWAVAIGITAGVVLLLVGIGRRTGHDMARAGLYGAATGAGFGLTAALMKGAVAQWADGIGAVLASWQLYAMVAAGAGAMYLLQNAVSAGELVAAQPGFTIADPVVAILWGTLVFGEVTRQGWLLAAAVLSFAVIVVAVLVLSGDPAVREADDVAGGPERERSAQH